MATLSLKFIARADTVTELLVVINSHRLTQLYGENEIEIVLVYLNPSLSDPFPFWKRFEIRFSWPEPVALFCFFYTFATPLPFGLSRHEFLPDGAAVGYLGERGYANIGL